MNKSKSPLLLPCLDKILKWRAEGKSQRTIAALLLAEFNVKVHPTTLGQFIMDQEPEKNKAIITAQVIKVTRVLRPVTRKYRDHPAPMVQFLLKLHTKMLQALAAHINMHPETLREQHRLMMDEIVQPAANDPPCPALPRPPRTHPPNLPRHSGQTGCSKARRRTSN